MIDGMFRSRGHALQIEVTFDIDANGIVSVSEQEQTQVKNKRLFIQSSVDYQNEIDQMVKDADK